VQSEWEPGESGPARRSYRITGDGLEVLTAWMSTLEKRVAIIDKMLGRYRETLKGE